MFSTLEPMLQLSPDLQSRVRLARDVRNIALHGSRPVTTIEFVEAAKTFEEALRVMETSADPIIRNIAQEELQRLSPRVDLPPLTENEKFNIWIAAIKKALHDHPGTSATIPTDQMAYAERAVAEGALEWIPGLPGTVVLRSPG